MNGHDIFWLIAVLIAMGLVLQNPNGTANVITAIGGFFTAETSTLQGKSTGYPLPTAQTQSTNLFGF